MFLAVLFVYSVLVALFLPTPVEIALVPIFAEPALFGLAAVTIGAGKAAGSGVIYLLGRNADRLIEKTSAKHRITKRFVDWAVQFVSKTRYLGLFLLLIVPFMSDTVPLYVYSLFNHNGAALSPSLFVATNFLAGLNRAFIVLIAIVALGTTLLL